MAWKTPRTWSGDSRDRQIRDNLTYLYDFVSYETQSGSWAAPSDSPDNGTLRIVYNSTQAGSRLYVRSNDAWLYVGLT